MERNNWFTQKSDFRNIWNKPDLMLRQIIEKSFHLEVLPIVFNRRLLVTHCLALVASEYTFLSWYITPSQILLVWTECKSSMRECNLFISMNSNINSIYSYQFDYCPSTEQPVCGSSLKIYPNVCTFKKIQCRFDEQQIILESMSPCESSSGGKVYCDNKLKVILYSYLILKKMHERITDS